MIFRKFAAILISLLIFWADNLYPKTSVQSILQKSKSMDDSNAIGYLIKSSRMHPDNHKLFFQIAWLYQKMNRRRKAREYYQKTLKNYKCHSRAWNNLGNIYLDKNENATAKSHYLKSIKCNPRQISAHYNLGNIYRKSGQMSAALSHYTKALRIDPNHFKSHHNLGLVYFGLLKKTNNRGSKQWEMLSQKTRFHFSKSLQIKKNDVYSYYNRGLYFQLIGDKKNAVSDFRRAYLLLPTGSRFRRIVFKKIRATR